MAMENNDLKEKIRKNEVKYLFSIGNKMDKVHYI